MKKGRTDKLVFVIKTEEMRNKEAYNFVVKIVDKAPTCLNIADNSLTLYAYDKLTFYDSVCSYISLNNNDMMEEELVDSITYKANCNRNNAVEYDKIEISKSSYGDKLKINAKILDATIKPGTYSYTFTLSKDITGDKKDATAKLSIKVVKVAGKVKPSVRLKTKGKLDVLDQDSKITFIPIFSNANETNLANRTKEFSYMVKGKKPELIGKDAELFYFDCDNNAISIRKTSDMNTKQKYKVKVRFYLYDSEMNCIPADSQVLSLTVTQSKAKAVLYGNTTFSLYQNSRSSIRPCLYNNDGKPIKIGRMTFTDPTGAFYVDTNEDGNIKFNNDGTIEIEHSPLRGITKKGKTYKVTFNFYPEGCAYNEKPISVPYTIKIAK